MAGNNQKFSHTNDARFQLEQRQLRESMGDEAYEKMIASTDNRGFFWFGIVFIVTLGAVVFGVAWFGL